MHVRLAEAKELRGRITPAIARWDVIYISWLHRSLLVFVDKSLVTELSEKVRLEEVWVRWLHLESLRRAW